MEKTDLSRRKFLKASVIGAVAAAPLAAPGCGMGQQASSGPAGGPQAGAVTGAGPLPRTAASPQIPPVTVEKKNGMPYRLLGKTGAKVSILGIGGFHIGVQASPEDS